MRSYGEEEKEGNNRMECRSNNNNGNNSNNNNNKQLLSTACIPDIMLGALPSIIPILQTEEIEV